MAQHSEGGFNYPTTSSPQPIGNVHQARHYSGSNEPIYQAQTVASLPNSNASTLAPNLAPELVHAAYEHPLLETLFDFERMALQVNPSLGKAKSQVIAVQFEADQASLNQNPILGVFGEEIGNNDQGIYGAYLQRKFIRQRKRELRRHAQLSKAEVLQMQLEQQRLRILTDVRTSFYRLLIAQRQTDLAQQLYNSQAKAIDSARQLFEAQETPKTNLLQTEIQAQQTEFKLRRAQANQKSAWRELVSVIGQPDLPMHPIKGELDQFSTPKEWNTTLKNIVENSPEMREAHAKVAEAEAILQREIGENLRDVNTQFSFGQDTATDDFFGGFQIGVPLRTQNCNQGNIGAARARFQAAVLEVQRVELAIQKRLAAVFGDYKTALEQSKVYTDQLIPKARQTLDLVTQAYREGEIGFLQLLSAQQTLTNVTTEYLGSLRQLWDAQQQIDGLLLFGSLQQ